jgi:orotate phosphoribosyltransferase
MKRMPRPSGRGIRRSQPRIAKLASVIDARKKLIEYITADAVFHGDFTLTSGKKATYYVDLRRVSLDHRVAPLIGQVMIDLIQDVPDVVAVGGMTMGADPVAAAVLHQGAARGLAYDAFVVRKEPKDHGRGKQVEGPELAGKRVIVLEDTSTTGGSPLAAIEALKKVGAEIAGVAVVVDRNTGAREIIEAAGYPYFAAIGLSDLGLE